MSNLTITVFDSEGREFRISQRQDVRTLWWDTEQIIDGEAIQCASDRSLEDALDYINPRGDDVADDAMPCGCTDYHMADCPLRTCYEPTEWDDDAWYDREDVMA